MGHKRHGKQNDPDLLDTEELLRGVDLPAESDWSLEEILAEYESQEAAKELARETGKPPPGQKPPPVPEAELTPKMEVILPEEVVPRPPRPISVEEVVGRTVDTLMSEEEPLLEEKPRRTLFSRRRIPDTEEIYYREPEPDPEPEPELLEPEPPLGDISDEYRRLRAKLHKPLPAAITISAVLTVLMALDYAQVQIPFWTGQTLVQTVILLTAEVMVCILGRNVFARGFHKLFQGRCTPDLMAALSCIASAGDCVSRLLWADRCANMPFAAVSCVCLCFAMRGGQREAAALYDCYRMAALNDDPPYLVTDTAEGACKQRGSNEGFYYLSESESTYARQMAVLLPVFLVASVVFGVLASVGQQRPHDFFWCWSAILTAAAGFGLPLAYTLPLSRLAKRLQKSGGAVAGYAGAERVSRKKTMIVTDTDLFPPGTLTLNGMKLYSETLNKVVTYAASLARASGGGFVRLFDSLMQSEGGRAEPVDDFSFYEEGGVSGTIHGETVLLGTVSFMRKMEIRIPAGINLKTGIFLAVDHHLVAVFAVKYLVSENVEWALRSMRRGRITPILAVRDGNITPALIKRKFGAKTRLVYPELSARLALSEMESGAGLPDALLFREGLMPYAETVAGSRRYSHCARRCTWLSLLGSFAGTMLAFYLTFVQAYTSLTPLAMLVFLLLWTLPTLLLSGWVDRY